MTVAVQTVTTIDLDHEQMFVLAGGPQSRVRVLYGATWLTEEGRPGDDVLRTGEEVPLHGGRVVVEGLAPARLQIVTEGRQTPSRRIVDGLRRMARHARHWLDAQQLGAAATATRD